MPDGSPQLEDGYTRIANELYDAILLFPFSKRELLIVFLIIRQTYGFNKKFDDITMTQIAEKTGLSVPHVSVTVRDLCQKRVLLIQKGEYGKVIGLSKNYSKWKKPRKQRKVTKTVSYQNSNVTETVIPDDRNSNTGLPKQSSGVTETVHTKDTPKKHSQKTTPKGS